MAQLQAQFVKSINGTDKILFDRKPHIAFIGRSNVGKSSLINSLCGRKSLARSSSAPGKTTTIDFFDINSTHYFVDLPGYGFAHANNTSREHYRKLISWYLFRSGVTQKLAILIVDAKVGITDFDRETISLLTTSSIPFCCVANKIDKLKQGEKIKQMQLIQSILPSVPVIPYSTKTGEGKNELLQKIFSETKS